MLACVSKGANLLANFQPRLASFRANFQPPLASLRANFQPPLASLHPNFQPRLASLYANFQPRLASLHANFQPHVPNYRYLDSPTTLNFWGLSRKMTFFSESTFFEIKYCFLHVSDVHSWRYSWNCGNQINVPHCQLATHCCRCHFCFGCLKVQEQRFPNYWFSFTCLMPWFRSCLLWVLDALCSFIIARMRVGLNTQLQTRGWIAQFWWQLVLGRFAHTTQTCKGLFSSNVPFFAEGRPDGVRKYGKTRPKYGNIRPAWTRPNQKDFFPKNAPFFFTSVRPSVKTVSAAGTRRSGRVDVLKPRVYFRIKVILMLFGSNLVPFRSTLEIVKSSGCFPAASKWDLAAFQESLLVLFSAHWKRKNISAGKFAAMQLLEENNQSTWQQPSKHGKKKVKTRLSSKIYIQ